MRAARGHRPGALRRRRGVALLMAIAGPLAASTAAQVPGPDGGRSRSGSPTSSACAAPSCARLVFFGTRAGGPGTGISGARFDERGGLLTPLGVVGSADHPTWLLASPHRPIVYAVKEVGNDGSVQGGVLSFAADVRTGRLSPIAEVGSGGGGATFLALNANALPPAILVANYGTGDVTVVPLGQAGALGPVISGQRDVGSGPNSRQRSAHPHGIAVDPTGRYVLVSDLGADRVFVYRYDPSRRTLLPSEDGSVAVPPGSGLRHIVFSSDGRFAYANAELTGDIAVFGWDARTARLTLRTTVPTRAPGYRGELSSAEIATSPDGRFLYLSNRGADELLAFAIDAASGGLSLVQRLPSGGKAPASFELDPGGRWMLVANEGSNRVMVFARDPASGRLAAVGPGLSVADPTSVAFLPQ